MSERQYKNWRSGNVKSHPRTTAALVLERLFPPWTIAELLAPPRTVVPGPGNRRRQPHVSAEVDIEIDIDDDAVEAVQFAQAAAATNVHPLVLDQLDADTARLADAYRTRPSAELVDELRAGRRTAFRLIEGRQYPRQALRLHLAAARLCGLAGIIALDAGRQRAAADLVRTAELCARLGGDPLLLAWIRAAQSAVAYAERRERDAVALALSGHEFLGGERAGTVTAVRLFVMEACARARIGDTPGTLAALAAAHSARQRCMDEPFEVGVFAFSIAEQEGYMAGALLDLGGERHAQAAIEAARRAVTAHAATPAALQSVRDLAAAHVVLAAALVRFGEPLAAARQLGYVAELSPACVRADTRCRLVGLAALPLDASAPGARELLSVFDALTASSADSDAASTAGPHS
ncbi:hypothetical protein [Yinghuangia sp. YIM S09857]|uniref:hypothetical protein n=1 Tax=Yinghuangia sp. YIM S09857 TaxID=3436929 RepID=UPI003F539BE9